MCGESKTANNVEVTRNEEVVKILAHGSTKKHDKPYIRTSNKVFEVEDLLVGSSSNTTSDVHDKVLESSGGPFHSSSQSHEPRNIQQVYRRKSLQNKKDKTEDSTTDEIMKILHAQQSCQPFTMSLRFLKNCILLK